MALAVEVAVEVAVVVVVEVGVVAVPCGQELWQATSR